MKIAYLLDFFPVYSETFILNEIFELRRRGFDICIFSVGKTANRLYGKVVHSDVDKLLETTYYFPALKTAKVLSRITRNLIYLSLHHPLRLTKTFSFCIRHEKKISRWLLLGLYYAVYFERIGIKHIRVHFALGACKQAMIISMLSGIEYSFTVHAHDIFLANRSELMIQKFEHAKFVVSISEFNRDYILEKYPAVSKDKIRIIHCGIDLSKIEAKNKGNTQRFFILSIGRLVEQKGFKFLIAACHILKKRFKLNFSCKIIGEGEDRQELEDLISRYELEQNVFLIGIKKHDEVIAFLKDVDLFVLPCVVDRMGSMDGIPVALMEAMAMQIPVISTNISGIPELIKNDCGKLIEPEDAEGLARTINAFFELPPAEKKAIGKNARHIIEKSFNLSVETEKLAKLIQN
jgi:glycosyltransferase involved in cell wall biosynthesis